MLCYSPKHFGARDEGPVMFCPTVPKKHGSQCFCLMALVNCPVLNWEEEIKLEELLVL